MRMKKQVWMFGIWTVLVVALSAGRVAAYAQSSQPQSSQPHSDTYEWSAEMVAFDEATRMLTVKAMTAGDVAKQVAALKPGEKVLLTWSAFDKYASAVNGVLKYDATRKPETRHAFAAEFVAFDANLNYVTFKAPVPADSVNRIKALKAGQWVTATSKQGAHAETQAITSVRGYNDVETTAAK